MPGSFFEATHVSPTELLYNWIPLLGATEPGARIGSDLPKQSPGVRFLVGSVPRTSRF